MRKCQVKEQDTLGQEAELKGASKEVLKDQIDVDILMQIKLNSLPPVYWFSIRPQLTHSNLGWAGGI